MAMPPRSRLGRGLGSLLSMTDAPAAASDSGPPSPAVHEPSGPAVGQPVADSPLTQIAVEQIDVNPHQPRKEFDSAALDTLADSIKANGVIQPITVRPLADGRYELIAGERRLRAARQAKFATIPAIVRTIDGFTQAQWALVENIHREDLNPIDRADAYATLMQQLGLTQAELAGRLGEHRSSVANYLRLHELDVTIREDLRQGALSFGHAKVLASVTPIGEQRRLADLVRREHLSVRNLERIIEQGDKTGRSDAPPTSRKAVNLHLKEVEEQMIQQLGLRVQLRGGKKGSGKVVIHYQSLEQFDDLMRRCGVEIRDV